MVFSCPLDIIVFCVVFVFSDSISLGWLQTHYTAETGLKLTLFLPQPPKHWDYRHASPCLVSN